jgi:enoyl-CoA hydratase/carnithine racemase
MSKASHPALNLEHQGHTALLTLNNPPAHTWTPESLDALATIISELNADKNNYALIITGSGQKFFSAGADLNQFNHSDNAKCERFSHAFANAFTALANYQGVSIAAINGFAMGGGLETALACDIRIAEPHAQMALPECSVGLLPCGLGTQHLGLLVGEQWAKRMILLGERLTAEQALSIGLISEIVAAGTVIETAQALAAKTAKQSPLAVRYCKELIMSSRDKPLNQAISEECEKFALLWGTDDQKEGVSAFIEKRKPEWKNQ